MLAPVGAAMTFRIVRDLGQSPAAFGLTLTGLGRRDARRVALRVEAGPGTNVARVLVLRASCCMGAPFIAAAAIDSLPVIVALTALSGAGEAALVVVYVSVRAANSPDALVGRIASTARVMALGLMPIGSLIGGVLIDALGGTETLAILGAALCVIAHRLQPGARPAGRLAGTPARARASPPDERRHRAVRSRLRLGPPGSARDVERPGDEPGATLSSI